MQHPARRADVDDERRRRVRCNQVTVGVGVTVAQAQRIGGSAGHGAHKRTLVAIARQLRQAFQLRLRGRWRHARRRQIGEQQRLRVDAHKRAQNASASTGANDVASGRRANTPVSGRLVEA
jgi:hypothetical protein